MACQLWQSFFRFLKKSVDKGGRLWYYYLVAKNGDEKHRIVAEGGKPCVARVCGKVMKIL